MYKKLLFLVFAILMVNVNCIFAASYDISNALKAKKMSDYNSTTTPDQMDTVLFGSYPQSDVTGAVKEPIEWLVGAVKDEKVYLFSKKILDVQNPGISDFAKNYKDYKLREWLNNYFFANAFNNTEQNIIENLEWGINYVGWDRYYNPSYGNETNIGGCNDKVTLPSIQNLSAFIGQNVTKYDARLDSEPTPFALANIKKVQDPDNGGATPAEKLAHEYWTRTHLDSDARSLWYYSYSSNTTKCLASMFSGGPNGYKGVRPYIAVSLKNSSNLNYTNVANGWIQSGSNWYYYQNNQPVKNQWIHYNGNWYYLDVTGVLLTNTQTHDGCYVDYEGKYINK